MQAEMQRRGEFITRIAKRFQATIKRQYLRMWLQGVKTCAAQREQLVNMLKGKGESSLLKRCLLNWHQYTVHAREDVLSSDAVRCGAARQSRRPIVHL